MRANKLTAIPGTPPNLKRPPSGCRFAERCKYATFQCRGGSVIMTEFGDGRSYRCGMSVDALREVYAREQQ